MWRKWKGEVLLSAGAENFVSQDYIHTGLTDNLTAKLTQCIFWLHFLLFYLVVTLPHERQRNPRRLLPSLAKLKVNPFPVLNLF